LHERHLRRRYLDFARLAGCGRLRAVASVRAPAKDDAGASSVSIVAGQVLHSPRLPLRAAGGMPPTRGGHNVNVTFDEVLLLLKFVNCARAKAAAIR
jgi:hypothetical protein